MRPGPRPGVCCGKMFASPRGLHRSIGRPGRAEEASPLRYQKPKPRCESPAVIADLTSGSNLHHRG